MSINFESVSDEDRALFEAYMAFPEDQRQEMRDAFNAATGKATAPASKDKDEDEEAGLFATVANNPWKTIAAVAITVAAGYMAYRYFAAGDAAAVTSDGVEAGGELAQAEIIH